MNSFDWNNFETSEPENTEPSAMPDSEQEFNWDEYQIPKEDHSVDPVRQVTRTGSRIMETILGLPADIKMFGETVIESIVPPFASDVRALMGKKRLTKEDKEKISQDIESRKNIFQKGLDLLPTSQELKEFSSSITQGFTDPQNAQEELADEIVSLGTSLLIGKKDPLKFKELTKAVGKAAGAKGVGKGIELLGGTEKERASFEIGTLFLTDMLSKNFANRFVSEKYEKAKSLIPPNTMVNTGNLQTNLGNLENTLKKGLPKTSPVKTEVLKTIDELNAKIAGGSIPVEDLVQGYHDINDKLLSKDLFDSLKKSGQKKLRSQYDNIKKTIDTELSSYGVNNPEFYNEWKEANRAKAVLASSENAKDFIISNMKSIPGHLATGVAIKLFMGAPALTAAGGGFAAYQTGKILKRIASDPSLRKYYLGVIKSVTEENFPAMVNSLNKLEKELSKEENID